MKKIWYLIIANILIYFLAFIGLLGISNNQSELVSLFLLFLMMLLLISTSYFLASDIYRFFNRNKTLFIVDFSIRLLGIVVIFYGVFYIEYFYGILLLISSTILLIVNFIVEKKILKNYIIDSSLDKGDNAFNQSYFGKILYDDDSVTDKFKKALSLRLSVMFYIIIIIVILSSISFVDMSSFAILLLILRITIGTIAIVKCRSNLSILLSLANNKQNENYLIVIIIIGLFVANLTYYNFGDSLTAFMISAIFSLPTEHISRRSFIKIKDSDNL